MWMWPREGIVNRGPQFSGAVSLADGSYQDWEKRQDECRRVDICQEERFGV